MTTAPMPVLISWGLGADSSAILAGFIEDPTAYGLTPDLCEVTVIVALTGEEWPDTMELAERHILPLLRRHRIRLVQVARGGPSDSDGITVLSDTRTPDRLYRRGPWTLSDELAGSGTVPQFAAHRRLCSQKFKGWVMDQWARAEYGDRPYRHVIGYEANEEGRADRDTEYATATRQPWYPLIDWGWDRPRILRYLADEFAVPAWPKSYCTMCPYPAVRASLDAHMARCRDFPELAAAVLRLEYNAMALNPRSTLYADGSLASKLRADGNTAALQEFDAGLAGTEWAVYDVRRVYFAGRSAECRQDHGTTCRRPGPGCRDPHRKGPAWRSLCTVYRGTREQVTAELRRRAATAGEAVITVDGIARVTYRTRGATYPGAVGLLVAAPAGIPDKERDGFTAAWQNVTGEGLLFTA